MLRPRPATPSWPDCRASPLLSPRTSLTRSSPLQFAMLAVVSTLTAYQAPLLASRGAVSRASCPEMAVSKPMAAMPFLTAAKCQSSGLPGAETGFDPLYFSDFLDIKWLREAEIKHGRICMLAATGYMFQEFFSLPGYPGYSPNAVEAFSSVPSEGLWQILFFVSWFEVWSNKGKFTMMNMFEDPKRVPGDLGIDPLKFGENAATRDRLEMAELKNGRLAMLAFSGMIHQTFVTGKPLFASLGDIFS